MVVPLAYNRGSGENGDRDNPKYREETEQNFSISEPLTFWIGLVVIAAVLQLIAIPFMASQLRGGYASALGKFAEYILYIPGVIVLPLLASLWIGEIVSKAKSNHRLLLYKGLVNAIYASIIYIVSISVVYIIMMVQGTGTLASVSMASFIEFNILVPFLITIIVVPLFSFLTAAKS